MADRRTKAKELLHDMGAEMNDEGLMEKYGLSAKGNIRAMNRLFRKGLMSLADLAERRASAKIVCRPLFKCSSCSEIQFSKTERCSHCGGFIKNLSQNKSSFD